jgi:hypothetical protein
MPEESSALPLLLGGIGVVAAAYVLMGGAGAGVSTTASVSKGTSVPPIISSASNGTLVPTKGAVVPAISSTSNGAGVPTNSASNPSGLPRRGASSARSGPAAVTSETRLVPSAVPDTSGTAPESETSGTWPSETSGTWPSATSGTWPSATSGTWPSEMSGPSGPSETTYRVPSEPTYRVVPAETTYVAAPTPALPYWPYHVGASGATCDATCEARNMVCDAEAQANTTYGRDIAFEALRRGGVVQRGGLEDEWQGDVRVRDGYRTHDAGQMRSMPGIWMWGNSTTEGAPNWKNEAHRNVSSTCSDAYAGLRRVCSCTQPAPATSAPVRAPSPPALPPPPPELPPPALPPLSTRAATQPPILTPPPPSSDYITRFRYVKDAGITAAEGGVENVQTSTAWGTWYAVYSLKESGVAKRSMRLTMYVDGTLLPPQNVEHALLDVWVGTGDPSIHYVNNKVFVIGDGQTGADSDAVGGVSTSSNSIIVYTVTDGSGATLTVNGVGRSVKPTVSNSFERTTIGLHASVLWATFEWA